MRLTFFCTQWGCEELTFEQFLNRAKSAGFQGVELGFPLDAALRDKMVEQIQAAELEFIGQHYETLDSDFTVHRKNYQQRLENLIATKPKFINSQTGKDFFTAEQNNQLLALAHQLSEQSGIAIHHETHRGKFSFAAHITEQFIKQDKKLTLTADFSHWCSVAESLLENQQAALNLAISRVHHIHARVGNSQRAQISDPRAPECQTEVACHLDWWQRVVEQAKLQGRDEVTITPEFGPAPYMFMLPFTEQPITSQWDVNVFMMKLLTERIKLH
ncbi:sugar phosphate isomerase/epimerase family protein [Pseudoalteromonas sp.]|uniref:sugar phosphate isomerase/epimerase family protein n=1 Tax=unclassified Pseudoalteromonas TaxID=194690 RepID=UPI003F9B4C65